MLNRSSNQYDFDGVICFGGEDWWYHNRGHYDMQIMRQMSTRMPVLYVNSIGMRTPSPGEGRMFFSRVRRKMRSMRRGLVSVGDNLWVYSPFIVPSKLGIALGGPLVSRAVRAAAARRGITRPLVWVACPTAAGLLESLDPAAVVYQRTDRYECFKDVDADRIVALDGWLKARADLTVFCSTALYEAEAEDCRRATYADHGVDFDRFVAATVQPPDMEDLGRPRVGFVGGIDAHTFDAELFLNVARQLPEAQFALVGACSLPQGWCELPNVSLLGQRPYERVPAYMAACDVLIMPWNRSPWIEACNPVKLKEYLAVGRPIVSTRFAELRHYEGVVNVATDADAFAAAIRAALGDPGDPSPRRERVRGESWSSRVDEILGVLGGAPVTRPVIREVSPATPLTVKTVEHPAVTTGGRLDLAAYILLAGGLRPSPLVRATGRSVLDLSLTPERTVLDCWVDRLTETARDIPIRVVHDAILPAPWPGKHTDGRVLIEKEPKSLRGPAGVIGDLCRGYDARQCVIVAEAARYMGCSLRPLIAEHRRLGADITVAANADGTPAGVYAIRVGSLDLVPAVGFMDLKEQWLRRAVDAGLDVRVHELEQPGTLPLRTRRQFLRAVAVANAAMDAPVLCHGSRVAAGATVTGSVIMPGATVESDAVVVRSIVAPNCHIGSGTDIVDAVVHAGVCLSERENGAITAQVGARWTR